MSGDKHHIEEALPRFSLNRRIGVLVLLASMVVVGVVAALGIPLELIPSGFLAAFPRGQRPVARRPRPGGAGEGHHAARGRAQHRPRARVAVLVLDHRLRPLLPELQERHRHGCRLPRGPRPDRACAGAAARGRGPDLHPQGGRVGDPGLCRRSRHRPRAHRPLHPDSEADRRPPPAARRGRLGRGQRAAREGDLHRARPRAHRGRRPQHLRPGPGARRRQLHHGLGRCPDRGPQAAAAVGGALPQPRRAREPDGRAAGAAARHRRR